MFGGMHLAARKAYARAGMLYRLHIDLLYQCDLDCEHCYLDDKSRHLQSTEFWKDVLDQAAALGVFAITMSGGEIFLRKDLLDLIAHARKLGLFVQLKTHGGHIDAAVAETLARLGVSSVTLSYYATDPAVHDAITRRPGSHAATYAALGHLAAAGLLTIVNCVVMQRNRDAWRALIAECEARGVFVLLDGQLQSALSGDEFPKDLAIALDDMVALERHHLERAAHDCEVHEPSADWGDQKNCGAGHTSLYVSPEGDVMPCVMWPMPLGNLVQGARLADLWHGSDGRLADVRAQRQRDRELCSTCEVHDDCDFCAGQSWVETRTPTQALRHFCEKTRAKTLARAAAQGLPEPPMPAGLRDLEATPTRPRFTVRAAPRS